MLKTIRLDVLCVDYCYRWEKKDVPLATRDLSKNMTIELVDSSNEFFSLFCEHYIHTNMVTCQGAVLIHHSTYENYIKPALLGAKWILL